MQKRLRERTERRELLAEAGIAGGPDTNVRRRIQSILDLAGIPGGSSVPLAHEMKTSVDLDVSDDAAAAGRPHEAASGSHYVAGLRRSARPEAQGGAMEIWTNVLLDEYERQMALRSDVPEGGTAAT